jgi:hypothetical protein
MRTNAPCSNGGAGSGSASREPARTSGPETPVAVSNAFRSGSGTSSQPMTEGGPPLRPSTARSTPSASGAIGITATGVDWSSTNNHSGSPAGTLTRAPATGNALPWRGT